MLGDQQNRQWRSLAILALRHQLAKDSSCLGERRGHIQGEQGLFAKQIAVSPVGIERDSQHLPTHGLGRVMPRAVSPAARADSSQSGEHNASAQGSPALTKPANELDADQGEQAWPGALGKATGFS